MKLIRGIIVLAVLGYLAVSLWQSRSELAKLDYPKGPTRYAWQLPGKVVAALGIEPGDRVADLGAGDGYFTFWLADAVGFQGRVYAVDIDEHKVTGLDAKAQNKDYGNVDAVLGELRDPRLPDQGVDLIFLCNTYHHIESRTEYFKRLKADLRPGGRVAVIDMRDDLKGFAAWFATRDHWIARATLEGEMEIAGYRVEQRFDFLPVQSFVIFAADE